MWNELYFPVMESADEEDRAITLGRPGKLKAMNSTTTALFSIAPLDTLANETWNHMD